MVFGKNNGSYKHGFANHRLYKIYIDIKSRCRNKKHISYNGYGGRGIDICQQWDKNPGMFVEYCLENGWKPGLQIDRIDNDNGYCIGNIRFVTPKVNSRNTRNNVYLTIGGVRKLLVEWSELSGIGYHVIYRRVFALGWDADRAVSTKTRNKKHRS